MMTKSYSILPTQTLNQQVELLHPYEPPAVAHLNDPALHVMEDFKYTRAVTIKPQAAIDEALAEMKACDVKVLLVVEDGQVVGLISSEDILGEKPIKLMQERRLQRNELLTQMVMTPQQEIITFNIIDLRHAKVGNIIETLRSLKQHYALVIQQDETTQSDKIRGLFSTSALSQQLSFDVTAELSEAQSILELQKDLSD